MDKYSFGPLPPAVPVPSSISSPEFPNFGVVLSITKPDTTVGFTSPILKVNDACQPFWISGTLSVAFDIVITMSNYASQADYSGTLSYNGTALLRPVCKVYDISNALHYPTSGVSAVPGGLALCNGYELDQSTFSGIVGSGNYWNNIHTPPSAHVTIPTDPTSLIPSLSLEYFSAYWVDPRSDLDAMGNPKDQAILSPVFNFFAGNAVSDGEFVYDYGTYVLGLEDTSGNENMTLVINLSSAHSYTLYPRFIPRSSPNPAYYQYLTSGTITISP